jgi:hypothetical protein
MGGKDTADAQQKRIENIIRILMKNENVPNSGLFKDIPICINGYTIHIRGFVHDGVIKIATIFIP